MIPRDLASLFSDRTRSRGAAYAAEHRVHVTEFRPDGCSAVVSGGDEYPVDVSAEPGSVVMLCTCPFALDNGPCKHVWATLIIADRTGSLQNILRHAGTPAAFWFSCDDVFDDGPPRPPKAPPIPDWKLALDRARQAMTPSAAFPGVTSSPVWPHNRRIIYIADLQSTWGANGVRLEVATQKHKPDGSWSEPKHLSHETAAAWPLSPEPSDRHIAQLLLGARDSVAFNPYGYGAAPASAFTLGRAAFATTLAAVCDTGRCFVRDRSGALDPTPVSFDSGDAWAFRVCVSRASDGAFELRGVLRRGEESVPIEEPRMLHSQGIFLRASSFARFDDSGAWPLVSELRAHQQGSPVRVSEAELSALVEALYTLPRRPPIDLPADARVAECRAEPTPCVTIHPDPSPWRGTHRRLEPHALYGAHRVTPTDPRDSVFDRASLTVHHRDRAAEQRALALLTEAGAKPEHGFGGQIALVIHGKKLARLIYDLVAHGWRVEAEGAVFRAPGSTRASVRSGIDWFELSASVRYGDAEVKLEDLLEAHRTGKDTVKLPDGSLGLIPAEWLARIAPVALSARTGLRFTRSQTLLLDALLATVEEPNVDALFAQARAELSAFERVEAADPSAAFHGTLRDYQREGLGWMHFLRRFGLGGCLADDMGLGKTVQVLALLDARLDERPRRKSVRRPSLVVVPRSLVFNWKREAERFAPRLRVLDFTGADRSIADVSAANADVVLTTYGTLRRDAPALAAIEFDYAILDEAQAIKTASSASAKAARLIRAQHRLALTGTPIENRVEELWSLFEFLNPGMLGASTTFGTLVRLSRDLAGPGGNQHDVLGRALRPVILRRTKDRVARELPPRTEQTLEVELEGAQRKFYDDLLKASRRSVFDRIDREGMNKARMHVLEALLRLRQAACHPALVDAKKQATPCAKLDALVPTLAEIAAEGHKALVFSQFTSFLALARERLDAAGIAYEYLDGATRDRQARVDRFQGDAECPVFLISLKAGGHGLNLTAAEYVFILDPWWNPAVEAQAIDRAHRIGQTRPVVATRIVARDTIEQKILELQATKRALADAILVDDRGGLAQIGRAELELLLG